LFDTPIGCCAIAWRGDSIIGAALPEDRPDRVRSSMKRRFNAVEQPLPAHVRRAADAICSLLSGDRTDLSFVEVDFGNVSDFERQVYAAARSVAAGETVTYGELAARIGMPHAAQAVGGALGRNPCPIVVPCHRILGADGRSGGFSAPGGVETKLRMLEIEGARRGSEPGLFDRLAWAIKPAPGGSRSGRPSRAR
jgi:methylated-DNA-[protein]-cysteine S-methyltransferase